MSPADARTGARRAAGPARRGRPAPPKKRWKTILVLILAIGITSWLLVWGGAFSTGPSASTTAQPVAPPSAEAAPTPEPATVEPAPAEPVPAEPAPAEPAPRPAPVEPPPPPVTVPEHGSGQVRTAAFARAAAAGQRGKKIRVRVEVERELALDPEAVAKEAADALQDPRSWSSRGEGRFDFVGTGPADLTIRVLTPGTTDTRCLPLKTFGEVSCRNGSGVNLNARRWVDAVPDYRGDIAGYRQYVVNHEVGHYLGFDHSTCPGRGATAPVMMQQTKGLDGCRANSWPLPGWRP